MATTSRPKWAVFLVGALVLLLLVSIFVGLANYGQSLRHSPCGGGPPESDILTASEIEECVGRGHATWTDLRECLLRSAFRPRIESALNHRESRKVSEINKYVMNPRTMQRFHLNNNRRNRALSPGDTVLIIYVGNESNSTCGGSTSQWMFFVGSDDSLIGWTRK